MFVEMKSIRIVLLSLGGLFAAEIQFLREPFDDYLDAKHFHHHQQQQQQYRHRFPYSASNDSRLQLTSGRGYVSQSEL